MLQDLFTGLSVGIVYGVIGAGFVIVHRITGIVNFAQGELAMVGAFGAVVSVRVLPVALSIPAGAAAGALAGLLLYWLFFDRTMAGRAMSACAVNRFAAGVVGIDVVTMGALAFVLSGAITGAIGAAAVPLTFASASVGLTLALKGFVAAILGGFDKIGLAIVGGLLVGVVEAFAASAISTTYQEVIVLGLLLVLLVVRPTGLTRHRVAERV